MTEEERNAAIVDRIWYWLPARWFNGVSWFEVSSIEVTGDVDSGGANVMVKKDSADPEAVAFTNDELYGSELLSVDAARARVMGV